MCTRERGCVSELCTPKLGPNAGDGKRGKKQFQAPLADPYAEPNELLVPAVDDILQALRSALKNPVWGGRGKPKYVAVDAKEIVDRLEEILKPAGVEAGYYPPPSNEELMTIPGSDVGGGV